MRAAGYFRVSTVRQGTPDHFSLPVQREMFAARCAERGYEPTYEYVDTESGTRATRKGYQQMLADARAGLFDVIVVRSIDRFGRDADEITVRSSELRQAKVTIDAVKSVADADMPPTTQFLLRAIEAFLAEQESKQIAGRVMGGMVASAASGKWQGRAPYGYRLEGGQLVIFEPEAAVVRRIFDEFTELNKGPRIIARSLNEAGIRAPGGGQWVQQSIRVMIDRPAYRGDFEWHGQVIEDRVPAIIDRETWARAQARKRTRQRSPGGQTHTSPYLLSGILYCSCGARMTGRGYVQQKGGKSYPRRDYVCSRWADGGLCTANRHNAADLEVRVITGLVNSVGDLRETKKAKHSPTRELADVQRELTLIAGRRRKFLDGFSRGTVTDAEYRSGLQLVDDDEAEWLGRADVLRREIADADAARAELLVKPERIRSLMDDSLDVAEKKAILQTYVSRLVVQEGDPEPYE